MRNPQLKNLPFPSELVTECSLFGRSDEEINNKDLNIDISKDSNIDCTDDSDIDLSNKESESSEENAGSESNDEPVGWTKCLCNTHAEDFNLLFGITFKLQNETRWLSSVFH